MSRIATMFLSIAVGVALIAAWYFYVVHFHVPSYLLPRPDVVLMSAVQAFTEGYIWPHLWFTTQSTVIGYVVGCAIGVVLGGVLAEFQTLERALYPFIVVFQSMPKVALAPLLIVWFGFGLESKIVLVALICFFPVFINTFVGVRQADSDLVDVLRVGHRHRPATPAARLSAYPCRSRTMSVSPASRSSPARRTLCRRSGRARGRSSLRSGAKAVSSSARRR
jgi:NitT/TauT family transport system permease protein